jgi:hypothetical protein
MFVPTIYDNSTQTTGDRSSSGTDEFEESKFPSDVINEYIGKRLDEWSKSNKFETFDGEDIKPNIHLMFQELQCKVDDCVKKSGDVVSGSLNLLREPTAKFDAANKQYVDWLFSALTEKIDQKHSKNYDLDCNHYRVKNLQSPTELTDAANKLYVDDKCKTFNGIQQPPNHHLFSKGTNIAMKTYFFNPGFIVPHKIHVTSVGFSTSPYKYKIGEVPKTGEHNPTKLYFMVNNEVKSEICIEKNIQEGHILKEFDKPIIFEKGDNLMMVSQSLLDDVSVNIEFW